MEMIYFTAAGIMLYLGSDWILQKIEQMRGSVLPHRSVIFFLIILTLSVGLFQGIQHVVSHSSERDTTLPDHSPEGQTSP